MNILSINSHVAMGHVGNSAAVFALQRLGHEVWAVPTVVLSNHPGHGGFGGEAVSARVMAEVLAGMVGRGAFAACHAVLTGYLREPAQVGAAADAVAEAKAVNPAIVYCCDPVLGDRDGGLYVPEAVADRTARRLVALADIVTPNAFELERLAGYPAATLDEAVTAAARLRARGPRIVVCTSLAGAAGEGETIATLAATDEGAWLVRTPALAGAPHGAGDLLAALFLGRYLERRDVAAALGDAVSATFAVVSASVAAGADELALIATQDELVAPGRRFEVVQLG